MDGLFVFPPVHDFAMPYLAGPLLKGFIEQEAPDVSLICVDLNLEFFRSAISNYSTLLDSYRTDVRGRSVSRAVRAAVTHQNLALARMQHFAHDYEGHVWSLRNYRSSLDRHSFPLCMDFARTSTPFDPLYHDFLGRFPAPDFLSVSITVEDQIQPAFRLLYLARRAWPATPIILGGNLVNRICRFMDRKQMQTLCDYIILREGEIPLLTVLRQLAGRNGPNEPDPRIRDLRVSSLPPMGELDSLPRDLHTKLDVDFRPDFSDLPVQSYFAPEPVLPILMSRKCYWGNCRFCTIHSAWDPSHRERDPSAITNELETSARTYGVRYFRVVDEGCPPRLLEDICGRLRSSSGICALEMYGGMERQFLDRDFVECIADGGCRHILFGLESGEPDTIRRMSKQSRRALDVSTVFKMTARNGIHNSAFAMFGFPGEGRMAQRKTIECIVTDHNIHTAVVFNFVAELESPYARANAERLLHDGSMTEKISHMRTKRGIVPVADSGARDAERALQEIYSRRADLALTALLNDEARFILADRFGPDFAQQAVAKDPEIAGELSAIVKKNVNQRIRRRLS